MSLRAVRGLALLAAGALLFSASGLLVPGGFRIERSVVVKAPPAVAYRLVSTYDGWARWTQTFGEIDRTFVLRAPTGPREGSGMILAWDARLLGPGKVRINAAEPETQVGFDLLRAGIPFVIHGTVTVAREQDGTRFTVVESGRFGWSPLRRWRAYAKRREVDRELRELVASAKRVLEPGPAAP